MPHVLPNTGYLLRFSRQLVGVCSLSPLRSSRGGVITGVGWPFIKTKTIHPKWSTKTSIHTDRDCVNSLLDHKIDLHLPFKRSKLLKFSQLKDEELIILHVFPFTQFRGIKKPNLCCRQRFEGKSRRSEEPPDLQSHRCRS